MTDNTPTPSRWTLPIPNPTDTAQDYWEGRYRSMDLPPDFAVRVNPLLERGLADVPPDTALDLGCGTGGDAIWLAGQGWRVTAVDVSATVLRLAAEFAAEAGVADRIDWQEHDLSRSFPDGLFALVCAQFLHSPVAVEGEREAILARAARAVAPGGALVVVGHAGWPSWMTEAPFEYHFPTNAEVVDSLALEPDRWAVEVDEVHEREVDAPDGVTGTRADNLLRIRRPR